MTRYSDAALLKGDFEKLLKDVPKEEAWREAACDNSAEAAATEIAKHIFAFNQSIDQNKEKLEVTTFSAKGLMKVLGLTPGEGDLIRVDGMLAEGDVPCSMLFHAHQISLTFTKVPASKPGSAEKDEDDGLQIGFVIFDELRKRKSARKQAFKDRKLQKAKRRLKKAEDKGKT